MFIDVDTLQPGDDFVDAISERLGGCDLMLAVIGRRWLTITDESGRPRLQNQHDYVRLEIETALARPVRTIPVLVERAAMPRVEDLPEQLQPLVRRHAIELSDTRWEYDIGMLIENIRQMTAATAPGPNLVPPPKIDWRPWLIRAAAAAVVALAALLLWWAVGGSGGRVPPSPAQDAGATPVPGPGPVPGAAQEAPASSGPATPTAEATATFMTAAGMLFLPVKADQAAVFEEMCRQLKAGLARSHDAALREQGAGIRILRAAEAVGANPLYVMLMERIRSGADYEPLGLLYKTVAPGTQHASQVTAFWKMYGGAFASGGSKVSLTPLAAQSAAEPVSSTVPASGAKLSFTTPVGLILLHVKPDRTDVFEEMALKIIAGVRGTRDRDFRSQMSGLQIFRAVEPSSDAQVMFVILIDPVTPNAEYEPFRVLARTMTPEQQRMPETAEMWKRYADAVGGSMSTLSLSAVGGLETTQPIR